MASILVVGADRLGNIVDVLRQEGFEQIHHVSGRKSAESALSIPAHVRMVLVLTDFVNHNLAKRIKSKAKERQVPILFCKRSAVAVARALRQLAQAA